MEERECDHQSVRDLKGGDKKFQGEKKFTILKWLMMESKWSRRGGWSLKKIRRKGGRFERRNKIKS